MLREAVRVISKNLKDPFLAFLVARIVESRKPLESGYLLGAESRRILIEDVLPALDGSSSDRGGNGGEDYYDIDSTMLSVVCGMWLQDRSIIQKSLHASIASGIFRPPSNSLTSTVRNSVSVAAAVDWLTSSHYCSALQRAGIVHSFLSSYPAEKLKWRFDIGLRLMHGRTDRRSYSAFHQASLEALKQRKIVTPIEGTKETIAASDPPSQPGTTVGGEIAASKGFNFARLQKPQTVADAANYSNISQAPTMSGMSSPHHYDPLIAFDVPSPQPKKQNSEQFDPLAAFDVPPPQPKKQNSEPFDPLAAFDVPPPQPKKQNSEPFDPLAAFDVPPPQPKKQNSEPFDPLAAFDVPPPQPKKQNSEPFDPLAAFDVPPPQPKKQNSEPFDPLAAFDLPIERPVRKNLNP